MRVRRHDKLGALLVVWMGVAACSMADHDTHERSAYVESANLTDTNPDPAVVEVHLVASLSTVNYLAGHSTEVWAYRDGAIASSVGTVPGPVLRAKLGDEVIVHFRNDLPQATTVHWHGPRTPFLSDGSHTSQDPVPPGGTFEYRFIVKDAGSFWYHPHHHSSEQVERGLQGTVIFEGGVIPDVTADRFLVLDDVALSAQGALREHLTEHEVAHGRTSPLLLVNGHAAPVNLAVAAGGRERWRIVNAANGRFFNLQMPGAKFFIIGSDGGLLPVPYFADALVVAPGERYDVLVTFDENQKSAMALQTSPFDSGQGPSTDTPSVLINVTRGRAARALAPLPTFWRELPRLSVTPQTVVRPVVLGSTTLPGGAMQFTLNGAAWPDNFDQPLKLRRDDIEIWQVTNETDADHPFHLHGTFFEVLSDKTGPRPLPDGWKDTVSVARRSTSTLAVRFEEPGMWMLHCHVLEHADAGMMMNVKVQP